MTNLENDFIFIQGSNNVIKLRDGEIFGVIEEFTSRNDGADRASIAKVTLFGPDFLHYHRITEETYICLEGYGKIYLNGKIFPFHPGVKVIIKPGTIHAAQPEKGERLVFLCISSPAYNSNDVFVFEDRISRNW